MRIWQFYVTGFRSMTIGRKLWALIIIKLIVILLVMRLFFMPDVLSERCSTDAEKAEAVRSALSPP